MLCQGLSGKHMTNVQRVIHEPRRLIQSIPGVELEELADPDFCCGSAGIYNLVQYEESMKILDRKMTDVSRAVHFVELLMEAGGKFSEFRFKKC
ncbi:heterodisulfide reductase-related iron-sulfur binding cluster [Salisediminibacterium halotolerans]|uniref:Cysteine-rich domain-containing protein n=1 Tax=Salisediminibacterium halotolerans TaxID=517425 RepID=A0A1H9SXJ6_9BACI|nr:(Fe-S)-binding protein [Salisediminibacterium haloalkalitolerans]SER89524.1 Cysteine-rich domain-containing protein [Salisediminibacterium haloalkalitolerans]